MSTYVTTRTVRFSHCDPAGIIFYPRYFDLIHEAKEDWFDEALGWPFAHMLGTMQQGFPIVRLEADFRGPSRMGEELAIALTVPAVGGSSLHLHYAVTCIGEPRLDVRTVVVHIDLATGKPLSIGEDLRERIERFRTGPGVVSGAGGAAGERR
jgi:4-hydroxybenzoyl-CoA thioesterase